MFQNVKIRLSHRTTLSLAEAVTRRTSLKQHLTCLSLLPLQLLRKKIRLRLPPHILRSSLILLDFTAHQNIYYLIVKDSPCLIPLGQLD
jgi:hypothetical protein